MHYLFNTLITLSNIMFLFSIELLDYLLTFYFIRFKVSFLLVLDRSLPDLLIKKPWFFNIYYSY